MNHQALSSFIWSVADLLRGGYKQSEYGKVILPFTVLRRLDCALDNTKAAVLMEYQAKQRLGINPEPFLLRETSQGFYNVSPMTLPKLLGDPDHIKENLYAYVQSFSASVRDIFERFDFFTQVERLAKSDLLYLVTEKFAQIDLHPETVDNTQMGLVFEELIRKFAELSNETAGEHITPREVKPHTEDAWIDHEKTKMGYEIPFNRLFCVFEPPRSLDEIDQDLKRVTDRILTMIAGLQA